MGEKTSLEGIFPYKASTLWKSLDLRWWMWSTAILFIINPSLHPYIKTSWFWRCIGIESSQSLVLYFAHFPLHPRICRELGKNQKLTSCRTQDSHSTTIILPLTSGVCSICYKQFTPPSWSERLKKTTWRDRTRRTATIWGQVYIVFGCLPHRVKAESLSALISKTNQQWLT